MKHLIFSLLAFLAAAAWAQEPAKVAAKAEATKEAAKPEPVKDRKAAAKAPRRWNEDARHCLERGSNTEVIKCAEEFL